MEGRERWGGRREWEIEKWRRVVVVWGLLTIVVLCAVMVQICITHCPPSNLVHTIVSQKKL